MNLETNLNGLKIKSSSTNLILIKISQKKSIQTNLIIGLRIIKIWNYNKIYVVEEIYPNTNSPR